VIQRHPAGVIPTDEAAGWPQRHVLLPSNLCMAEIVNLRTARRQAKRRQAEQKAASNRLAHGRSKAERALERSQSDQARKSLDQRRIETGDGQ
jgi:hypothetical protein